MSICFAACSRSSAAGERKVCEVASKVGRKGAVAASGACASAGFETGGGGKLTAQPTRTAATATSAPATVQVFRNLELVSIKGMNWSERDDAHRPMAWPTVHWTQRPENSSRWRANQVVSSRKAERGKKGSAAKSIRQRTRRTAARYRFPPEAAGHDLLQLKAIRWRQNPVHPFVDATERRYCQ